MAWQSFTALPPPPPPPINSFSISLAFPEQFTTWHPIILGGGVGRGKVRVSRLLESRSDVYFLSPTAKIDKKKVRWADESRQQAASEGNDNINNND